MGDASIMEEAPAIMSFLSFVMFFGGIMLFLIGLVIVNSAKKEWHVFYDLRDKNPEYTEPKFNKKKQLIAGRVMYIAGILVFGISFLLV